ncbi:hypothetical protein [Desulfosudis oleivorans]|uniref:Uncharacterized protein n=1 Tax=Desulfosudis oleivorans (strain DSM 6200 / JCM 39069 / Hxd3) TaxID=96561 RepID=A8ZT01_DESOH|nr:hypothetical protein [Desulfosudis oleivorans]ABW66165.1 hypothetical protein Dole_0355 [Desulfosudis oleivorans Hxd3]
MDVKDFCSGLEQELVAWKAKLFDVVAKADRLGSAERERVLANFNDMKIIVQDLEEKINQLKTECPSDWSPQKKAIEKGHVDMRSKYEEAMEFIGKAAPVSIPG